MGSDRGEDSNGSYVDAEETRHAVKVVVVLRHLFDLGNDNVVDPVVAELLRQLLQVERGCFANRKHCKKTQLITQQKSYKT